jgi:hypothetical protein
MPVIPFLAHHCVLYFIVIGAAPDLYNNKGLLQALYFFVFFAERSQRFGRH